MLSGPVASNCKRGQASSWTVTPTEEEEFTLKEVSQFLHGL
jgi:hypothetical protein